MKIVMKNNQNSPNKKPNSEQPVPLSSLPPVVTGQMEIDPDVTAADLGVNAEPEDDDNHDFFKASTTGRGFRRLTFTGLNGSECTLQESSLASEEAIWIGAKNLEIKRCPRDCTGWHDVDLAALFPGQDVVGNEKMHLTQDQVRSLLPALHHFVETGELPTNPEPVTKVENT